MSDTFFRVWIGPKFERADATTFYDWSAAGLAATASWSTTLSATLTSGTTSASVAATTNFASKGGVWIAGNGTGEAWEYVGYTGKTDTTLTGLVRESTTYREHNGNHTSGAAVRQWIAIDTDNGQLRIGRELNETLCATSWYAELSGVRFPQHALRNEHIAVVQTAPTPTGTWTNLLTGFVESPAVTDGWEKRAEWRVRILSVVGMMGYTQARGVRVGEWDIAREATATSSPVIPGAHKEYDTTGFDKTLRSFEAQNVLDGRTDTLWVADEMIGTPNPPGLYSGFTQIYMNPAPSLGRKGYRWLEVRNRNLQATQIWAYHPVNGAYTTDQIGENAIGKTLIVCENEELFTRENPSQKADIIFDLSTKDLPDLFDYMDPAGGSIAFRFEGNCDGDIRWGTQTLEPPGVDWRGNWPGGDPLPAPGKDETMRRIHGTPHTWEYEYWEISRNQAPGHEIENNDDQVWIQVNLPGMAIELHEAIDDDDTTITTAWGDTPSTDGLPSSGTILIDDEEITYTGKTATTLTGCTRGANGSDAAEHTAGGKVYLMFDIGFSTTYEAVDGYPLKSTAWYNDAEGVTTVERTVLWSAMPDTRTPDDSLHERDYRLTAFANTPATSDVIWHSPDVRARTVLMQFETLGTDPARPRLSRIVCLVNQANWNSDYWTSSGTVQDALTLLAQNAGVPAAAITTTNAGAMEPDSHVTASDTAWAVMTDLADYGGAFIDVGLDSKLTHRPNTLWSTAVGGYTPDRTWTATDIVRIEKVWQRGQAVSQVKLDWMTPTGIEQASVVYPATTDGIGRVEEVGPYLYANSTAATLAARKRYYMGRYPYTALVQLATGNLEIEPGELHNVTWQFATDMQAINRLYLVKAVEHLVENGAVVTTLNLMEIDREAV